MILKEAVRLDYATAQQTLAASQGLSYQEKKVPLMRLLPKTHRLLC
jgi:hypothetical protein